MSGNLRFRRPHGIQAAFAAHRRNLVLHPDAFLVSQALCGTALRGQRVLVRFDQGPRVGRSLIQVMREDACDWCCEVLHGGVA